MHNTEGGEETGLQKSAVHGSSVMTHVPEQPLHGAHHHHSTPHNGVVLVHQEAHGHATGE